MVNASELISAAYDYEQALWAPGRMSVTLGCNCGCGGDSYTPEQYEKENKEAQEAVDRFKSICQHYKIEWDLGDL
jgi:hypothetical protein